MIGKSKASSRVFNRIFESSLFRESQQVNTRITGEDSENESVASQDDLTISNDGLSVLLNQSFEEVRAHPLSDHEIQAGISSLRDRPDLVHRFLPNSVTMDHMDHIFDGVRTVLSDPHLIRSAVGRINNKAGASLPVFNELPSAIPKEKSDGMFRSFEDLYTAFGCAICRDVLAAPVSLSCGCSFCGGCYQTLKDSCISSDIEVMPTCPLDRKPISSANYVRIMDDLICQEVSKMPESKDKVNWARRRQQYLIRAKDSRSSGSRRVREHEEFESIFDEIKYPIAVFTAIALVLIFIARNNSSF
jgi:hypothetical protein